MGGAVFPPAIYLGPNYGGGNEGNGDLLQRIWCMYCYTHCPQPCSRPLLTHASTGDSCTLTGKSGSVSCEVTAPFSWVLVHTRFCLCPPGVYFPVLCKFWLLYDGVNGDLLQEVCHTQVCFTQSPFPCGHPLMTHTSTGDSQTQFCLILCGVPESWWAQDLFEPSECLWREWDLFLNMNLPFIPSFWGFSFALGHGYLLKATPALHSPHSSAYHLAGVSLTLDVGYLLMAAPVPCSWNSYRLI